MDAGENPKFCLSTSHKHQVRGQSDRKKLRFDHEGTLICGRKGNTKPRTSAVAPPAAPSAMRGTTATLNNSFKRLVTETPPMHDTVRVSSRLHKRDRTKTAEHFTTQVPTATFHKQQEPRTLHWIHTGPSVPRFRIKLLDGAQDLYPALGWRHPLKLTPETHTWSPPPHNNTPLSSERRIFVAPTSLPIPPLL